MKKSDAVLRGFLLYKWRNKPSTFFSDITGYKPSPYQEYFLDELIANLENSKIIVSSGRGTGKTLTNAIAALWSCIVLPYFLKRPYSVVVLSGSREQSQVLYDYCRQYLSHPLLESEVKEEPTKSDTYFKSGGYLKRLAHSEKSVRGKHPDLLIIDEAALVSEEVFLSALPMVDSSPNPRIILLSTPRVGSLFNEIFFKHKEWGFLRAPYWRKMDAHWVSKTELEWAKKQMEQGFIPKEVFEMEYLGIPVDVMDKDAVFNRKDVRNCRVKEKFDLESEEVFLGIDFGFNHPTGLVLINRVDNEYRVVRTWLIKGERFTKIQKFISEIVRDFRVRRILVDASDVGELQRVQENNPDVVVVPVVFRNEKRRMQLNLKKLIETQRLKFFEGEVELIDQLLNYTWEKKKNDDLVDALMLAVYPELIQTHSSDSGEGFLYPLRQSQTVVERETDKEVGEFFYVVS